MPGSTPGTWSCHTSGYIGDNLCLCRLYTTTCVSIYRSSCDARGTTSTYGVRTYNKQVAQQLFIYYMYIPGQRTTHNARCTHVFTSGFIESIQNLQKLLQQATSKARQQCRGWRMAKIDLDSCATGSDLLVYKQYDKGDGTRNRRSSQTTKIDE